jgi:hypothetical protein
MTLGKFKSLQGSSCVWEREKKTFICSKIHYSPFVSFFPTPLLPTPPSWQSCNSTSSFRQQHQHQQQHHHDEY